jgi:hypothetical protein
MKYRYFIFPVLMIVLLGLLGSVSCDQIKNIKGSVNGTVYMDGRPVSGTILVKDANGAVVGQSRTNMNGHYQIKDLGAGTYTLQYLNMQGVPFGNETTVNVHVGKFETVDIQLKASDRMPINAGH